MLTELTVTGVVLFLLVFLSTIESAYESLSEVSLRVLSGEREDSPRRVRFFRELMEHRRRFELILILGTQLSIAAIAILLADVFIDAGVGFPLLLAFIDVGEEAGIIEESEGELIQSIIEFSDTRVAEVMRPRPQIIAIESTATVADARQLMIESKHSRIPVYRDQIDT